MNTEDDYEKYALWRIPQYDFPIRISLSQVIKRARWYRGKLTEHRKGKRIWQGTKAEYEAELNRLLERVQHYRNLRHRPDYAAEAREAKNKRRRKKRVVRLKRLENTLHWLVLRVKRKRFKTIRQLARTLKKPVSFVDYIKRKAIAAGLMTEQEWKESFRQPGRPRKGKPRGKYKTGVKPVHPENIRLSA